MFLFLALAPVGKPRVVILGFLRLSSFIDFIDFIVVSIIVVVISLIYIVVSLRVIATSLFLLRVH